MIAVFAYDFPHRKTHDFLVELATAGLRDVLVLAAPWQKLEILGDALPMPKRLQAAAPLATDHLCATLGFHHESVNHRDVEAVTAMLAAHDVSLGLVSGARILKGEVIESCPDGIVNFHPGTLPETSGLDAFFHTIVKGVPAGVTTHFIDARVDAGLRLSFDALDIGSDDAVDIVQSNLYQLQIRALRRFLSDREAGSLCPEPIDRPAKNAPMTAQEKWGALQLFPAWRAAQWAQHLRRDLFAGCKAGSVQLALGILNQMPDLLEARTVEGWTPLIVAAFHQNRDLVEALLDLGADPNATGRKGTTALMYAKTALLSRKDPDTALLDLLIARGADPRRRDMYGRALLDYVDTTTHSWLADFLRAKDA